MCIGEINMIPQEKYTLIAYRPDGVDSVMGCIQGRSSSEYDIISKEDIDSFLEQWAELVFRDMTRGYEDEPYEYTIFYQGNIINQYDGEDYNKFYASACILAEEKKRQKAEKEARCKVEREARYQKEKEEAEKKRLKELIEKYGYLKDE